MKNAIEIRHLTKEYGSFKLSDVTFDVPMGTVVGLIGENGAGKSTTIKCILNLVRPSGGEIVLLGRDSIAGEREAKEEIGVVLDESTFHDTLRALDVGKILRRVYKNWDQPFFEALLKKFGLPHNKTVKDYSRGMKMKLSIAAALSARPRLLILDEATGGLDPVVRDELLDEFLSFVQDEDHAILISSHITSDLEKAADYVVYLHKGAVVLQGAKDELLEEHGRLVCGRSDLQKVDPAFLVGVRENQFSCEALVRRREEFIRRYPELSVESVTLDDLMVFTTKGEMAS